MPSPAWTIVTRPQQREDDGKNMSGLVLYLASSADQKGTAVAQVGFDRDNTTQPELSFTEAYDKALEKARAALEKINASLGDPEAVQ